MKLKAEAEIVDLGTLLEPTLTLVIDVVSKLKSDPTDAQYVSTSLPLILENRVMVPSLKFRFNLCVAQHIGSSNYQGFDESSLSVDQGNAKNR